MKTKRILLLFLLIILSNKFYPQDNLNYYPFNIGNKWFFYETISGWDPPSISDRTWKLEILKDTLLANNKIYRKIIKSFFEIFSPNEILYERVDTQTKQVYRHDSFSDSTDFERVIFDFAKDVGDTIYSSNWIITFENKDSIEFFGDKYSSIEYSHIYGFVGYGDHYLENIGLYKYTFAVDFFSSESFLKGCLIDSVLYGDTIITSINKEINNIPGNFILYQNYPNPFNSYTIITFYLPKRDEVTIKVYDNLGREIENLVYYEMDAGLHKISFNADALASGVYFYSVSTNEFLESKKLILLK